MKNGCNKGYHSNGCGPKRKRSMRRNRKNQAKRSVRRRNNSLRKRNKSNGKRMRKKSSRKKRRVSRGGAAEQPQMPSHSPPSPPSPPTPSPEPSPTSSPNPSPSPPNPSPDPSPSPPTSSPESNNETENANRLEKALKGVEKSLKHTVLNEIIKKPDLEDYINKLKEKDEFKNKFLVLHAPNDAAFEKAGIGLEINKTNDEITELLDKHIKFVDVKESEALNPINEVMGDENNQANVDIE